MKGSRLSRFLPSKEEVASMRDEKPSDAREQNLLLNCSVNSDCLF